MPVRMSSSCLSSGTPWGFLISRPSSGLILVNLVTSVLRSIVSPMSGENADHPLQVLFRSLAAITLIHLFFGIHWSMLESDGLIAYLGRLFGTVLSSLSDEMRSLAGLGYTGGSSVGLLKRHIAVIILLGGLMSNVIGAAVTYVEREAVGDRDLHAVCGDLHIAAAVDRVPEEPQPSECARNRGIHLRQQPDLYIRHRRMHGRAQPCAHERADPQCRWIKDDTERGHPENGRQLGKIQGREQQTCHACYCPSESCDC